MVDGADNLAFRCFGPHVSKTGLDAGNGVVIAILDYGFDLLHPALLSVSRQRSRLKFLWDQNISGTDPTFSNRSSTQPTFQPSASSEDFNQQQLNLLINDARARFSRRDLDEVYDPHAHVSCDPRDIFHARGTALASLAAGTPNGRFRGLAPGADIIGVHLAVNPEHSCGSFSQLDERASEPSLFSVWLDYGNTTQLVDAFDYAYQRAKDLQADAVIICLADGGFPGPRDGSTLLEGKISELVSHNVVGDGPACLVVVGTGVAGRPGRSFVGRVDARSTARLAWPIPYADHSTRTLTIWHDSEHSLSAELILEDPTRSSSIPAIAARFDFPSDQTCRIPLGRHGVGVFGYQIATGRGTNAFRVCLDPSHFPASIARDCSGQTRWLVRLRNSSPEAVQIHVSVDGADVPSVTLTGPGSSGLQPAPLIADTIAVSTHPEVVHAQKLQDVDHGLALPGSGNVSGIALPVLPVWVARSKCTDYVASNSALMGPALVAGALAVLIENETASMGGRIDTDELLDLLTRPVRSLKPNLIRLPTPKPQPSRATKRLKSNIC